MTNEYRRLFDGLIATLRAKEAEEKKRYDSAINIEDMTEFTAVTNDARAKILSIRKWIDDFQKINDEVSAVFSDASTEKASQKLIEDYAQTTQIELPTRGNDFGSPQLSLPTQEIDLDNPVLDETEDVSNDTEHFTQDRVTVDEEEIKVGKHIQSKLHELSESGFVFTQEQIVQMCDLDWSRKTFTYDRFLPFAKIADMKQDVSTQTKDQNGRNRYWRRIFRFGDTPLFIVSQWYAKDKKSFDAWYDGLLQSEPHDTSDEHEWLSIPNEIVLLGKSYNVSGNGELIKVLCEAMILNKPYKFARLGAGLDDAELTQLMISLDEQKISEPRFRLTNGMFTFAEGSASDIKRRCERILVECGYSADELKIS
jgi:hypothetical protein